MSRRDGAHRACPPLQIYSSRGRRSQPRASLWKYLLVVAIPFLFPALIRSTTEKASVPERAREVIAEVPHVTDASADVPSAPVATALELAPATIEPAAAPVTADPRTHATIEPPTVEPAIAAPHAHPVRTAKAKTRRAHVGASKSHTAHRAARIAPALVAASEVAKPEPARTPHRSENRGMVAPK